jgi:hypothetical protein
MVAEGRILLSSLRGNWKCKRMIKTYVVFATSLI